MTAVGGVKVTKKMVVAVAVVGSGGSRGRGDVVRDSCLCDFFCFVVLEVPNVQERGRGGGKMRGKTWEQNRLW